MIDDEAHPGVVSARKPDESAIRRAVAALDFSRASRRRRISIAIVAGVLALIFLSQGIRAPFAKDQEPQSAQWIADMAGHGHWILCRDYYGYLCRKPPLYYWLSSIIVKLTGSTVGEVPTRVVSLVAGSAMAVEVLIWSADALGPVTGWLAFMFLLGSYGFASRATVNLTDMLLTALMYGAYWLIYPLVKPLSERPADTPVRPSRWRAIGAGVLIGLAILDKGPVALLLIALALFFFMLIMRRDPFTIARQAWPWECLLIAIVIGAAWYVPAYLAGGSNFLKVMLEENFGHLAPAAMGGTGEAARPIYYIVARLFGGMMPLSFLLIAAIIANRSRAFAESAGRSLAWQMAMATAVIFLFSLASAKRDDYILPAIPALAIVFAALFGSLAEQTSGGITTAALIVRDWTVALVGTVVMLGIAAALIAIRMHSETVPGRMSLQSSDAAMAGLFADTITRPSVGLFFVLAMWLAGVGALVAVIRRAPAAAIGAWFGLICLAGVSLFTGTIRPGFERERSPAAFASQVHGIIDDSALYVIGEPDYDFSFYYGRAVPVFSFKHAPAGWEPIFFVTHAPTLKLLPRELRARIKLVLSSDAVDRDGPLALYELVVPASGGYNRLH